MSEGPTMRIAAVKLDGILVKDGTAFPSPFTTGDHIVKPNGIRFNDGLLTLHFTDGKQMACPNVPIRLLLEPVEPLKPKVPRKPVKPQPPKAEEPPPAPPQ